METGLGKTCLKRIIRIAPPICDKCGRPQRLNAVKETWCSQCRDSNYYFSVARSVALYDGALREYLAELKYRYRPDLGEALGLLLVDWARLQTAFFKKIDLILSVPIHPQKMEVRGYNQAELLAKPLGRYLGIRVGQDILTRWKQTESQNALNKAARYANIDGAFQVVDASVLPGSRILLVDDIITTGATVSEAARVLLRAGAIEIKVLTLATGAIDWEWVNE